MASPGKGVEVRSRFRLSILLLPPTLLTGLAVLFVARPLLALLASALVVLALLAGLILTAALLALAALLLALLLLALLLLALLLLALGLLVVRHLVLHRSALLRYAQCAPSADAGIQSPGSRPRSFTNTCHRRQEPHLLRTTSC